MSCHHYKTISSGTPSVTICKTCGEDVTVQADAKRAENRAKMNESLARGEKLNIQFNGTWNPELEAADYRDPARPVGTSGFEEERRSKQHAAQLRQDIRDGNRKVEVDGLRHSMAIPSEVFYQMEKKDPNFWQDEKNKEKFKDYKVS